MTAGTVQRRAGYVYKRAFDHPSPARIMTLQRALLATVGIAILAGIVPAGIVLDRRLANALEARARADLALAPRVLADRSAATADAMMMHAKEFARGEGLAGALRSGNRTRVLALVEEARATRGDNAIVIGPDGVSWSGPAIDAALVAQTRAGKMPVVVRENAGGLQNVALAGVEENGLWVGAAGLVSRWDNDAAGVLSGLTRSDVVIVNGRDGRVAASTLDSATARQIAATAFAAPRVAGAREVMAGGRRRLTIAAPLGDAGIVLFTRDIAMEVAVLPELRRVAFLCTAAALCVALVLGALLAARVALPVRQLSDAAGALADGQFDAPLPVSRIQEVQRVATTFDDMRQALAARLAELRGANDALIDRNARLTALQADLMQRDRLSATGRLVTQLAHEIRNPVANLRNCLELIRRRVTDDAEAREFTDLAIDELLRMHELAEQMLDLNRPRDNSTAKCYPEVVAREVTALSTLGVFSGSVVVRSSLPDDITVAIAPDALKQVLFNLVQNAREAERPEKGRTSGTVGVGVGRIEIDITRSNSDVQIEVLDRGPGIPIAVLPRIFDPFFTTKDAVHGVGLGLFVAEGLVRTAGGRLSAGNRDEGGAWFRVEVPIVEPDVAATSSSENFEVMR